MGRLLLLNRNIPEAIPHGTYRFIPAYELGTSFLLTLDRYKPVRLPDGSRSTASLEGIRNGKPAYGHPDPSHRLSLARLSQTPGSHVVRTSLRFSYPVDLVGTTGQVNQWLISGNEDPDEMSVPMHRNAILITGQLAQLLLEQYWDRIDWEEEINRLTIPLQVNHEILKKKRV